MSLKRLDLVVPYHRGAMSVSIEAEVQLTRGHVTSVKDYLSIVEQSLGPEDGPDRWSQPPLISAPAGSASVNFNSVAKRGAKEAITFFQRINELFDATHEEVTAWFDANAASDLLSRMKLKFVTTQAEEGQS